MTEEDMAAKKWAVTAINLFNAGYHELELEYERKDGEHGKLRITIEEVAE